MWPPEPTPQGGTTQAIVSGGAVVRDDGRHAPRGGSGRRRRSPRRSRASTSTGCRAPANRVIEKLASRYVDRVECRAALEGQPAPYGRVETVRPGTKDRAGKPEGVVPARLPERVLEGLAAELLATRARPGRRG